MADELIVGAECSHRKEGGIYFPFLIASTIDSVSRVGGLRRRLKMSAHTTHQIHRVDRCLLSFTAKMGLLYNFN